VVWASAADAAVTMAAAMTAACGSSFFCSSAAADAATDADAPIIADAATTADANRSRGCQFIWQPSFSAYRQTKSPVPENA